MSKNEKHVHSMLDGMFLNSKVSSRMPLVQSQSKPTSLMKVRQTVPVKYQLDSLILTPAENSENELKAKIECEYDNLGRLLLLYRSEFDNTTNRYELDSKYIYRYGSDYMISDSYSVSEESLSFTGRTKTIYDENSRTLGVKYNNDTIDFENNSDRDEYVYENNLLSSINYFSSNSVTPYQVIRYYYDSMNRDTAEVRFKNNYFNDYSLMEYEKVKYTYDVNNDIISSENFNYINGGWILDYKYNYIYNNNHNCISAIESRLIDGVSVAFMKLISTYNESVNKSDTYCGDVFTGFLYKFKSQLNQINAYALNESESLFVGSYDFYYSPKDVSTGIDETTKANNEIVRYNAGQKTITLQNTGLGNLNQLQLYSLSGKQILNTPISTSGSVSVDKMGSGLYVYKIISSGKTIVGKILVQ